MGYDSIYEDPVYESLHNITEIADNDDTFIEERCGCYKPCSFLNSVISQEYAKHGWSGIEYQMKGRC